MKRHQHTVRFFTDQARDAVRGYCFNHLVGHRATQVYDRPDGTWEEVNLPNTANNSNDELGNDETMT